MNHKNLRVASTDSSGIGETPSVREYVHLLLNRKWTIAIVTGLVLAAALVASYRQTPLYQSQGEVLLRSGEAATTDGSLPATLNLETEREVATSDAVAAIAARELGQDAADIQGGLTVDVAAATEILIFTYEHIDPEVAQQRAAAFSNAYVEYRRRQVLGDLVAASQTVQDRINDLNVQLDALNTRIAKPRNPIRDVALQSRASALISQIAILQQELADLSPPDKLRVGQVVDQPALAASPFKPDHIRNGLVGLLAGLVLGVLLAFLREQLDDSLKGRGDLEAMTRAAVLAAIPKLQQWKKGDSPITVTMAEPTSTAAEAYRKLRTGVLYSAIASQAKVLMITSPNENEGKTATTANLGVVLAQAEKRVIMVSADLRKPRLHRFFGQDNTIGVTNALAGEVSPWQVLRQTEIENLQLLGSGPIPHNPAELLGSAAMKRLLDGLREVADFVLIDAPPIMAVADPVALAPLADGVLFVADAKNSSRGMIEAARRQLDHVDAIVMGSILNNVDSTKSGGYYYASSYGYSEEKADRKWTDTKLSFGARRSAGGDG